MASVFPLVKLTSGPDTTATVLHDFNVDDTLGGAVRSSRVQSEGFTIGGAPELLGDRAGCCRLITQRVAMDTTHAEGAFRYGSLRDPWPG